MISEPFLTLLPFVARPKWNICTLTQHFVIVMPPPLLLNLMQIPRDCTTGLEHHDMAHLSGHVSLSIPPMLIDCECNAGAAESNCDVKGRRIQFWLHEIHIVKGASPCVLKKNVVWIQTLKRVHFGCRGWGGGGSFEFVTLMQQPDVA